MSQNNKTKLAFRVLIGAIVGFVTGLLSAPKSGQETRADIKQTAHKASEVLSAKAKQAQVHLSQLITKAEDKLKQTKQATGSQSRQLVDRAKHAKSQVGDVAKAVKDGQATDKDLDAAVKKANAAVTSLKSYLKK